MTILRSGSTEKYAANWTKAFGGKADSNSKNKTARSERRSQANGKSAKKKNKK